MAKGAPMSRSIAAAIMGTFVSMRNSAVSAKIAKIKAFEDAQHDFRMTDSGLPSPHTKPTPNHYGHGGTQRCMNETGNKASRRIAKQIAKGMLKKENGLA
jgi:hypothetical protein